MKRILLVTLLLTVLFTLQAKVDSYLGLKGPQFTPSVIAEINRTNDLVRGPSFNFTSSPFNLPTGSERFYEDTPWEKDFTEFIAPGSYTDLNSLVILTSSPEHFIVTFPNPTNPRVVRFVPRPENWYGSELMAVSVYEDYGSGNHSEPYTAVLRLNVTSVPDPPVFHDMPVANTFYTDEDTELTVNFQDLVYCIDSAPANFDLFVTQTQLVFPYSVDVRQSPTSSGQLVTFDPLLNFNGSVRFIITAVDRQSNAFTPVEVTLVVRPENDPPQIVSYLPAVSPLLIDQNATQNFSVNVVDPDGTALTETWTLSGILNGVPFSNVVSTTSSLSYLFNIPGNYTLVYNVTDGIESDSVSWIINVRPIGPIFDPWGATFDHGISVILQPPTGFEGAVIYYTTDGSTPTISSDVYNQPIPVPALGDIENLVTIKAFYTYPDIPNSQIVSSTYRITGRVANPVFNPVSGLYYSQTNVSITCPNLGASVYYTLDGSDPVIGNPNTLLYSGPILVPTMTSVTIKAIAVRTGWINSNIVTSTYNITGVVTINTHTMNPLPPVAPDFLTVEPGTSIPVVIENLTMTPPTAVLYYTLDNSIPGPSNPNSFIYHTGMTIPLTCPTWITIRAFNADWLPSATYSYYYDVRTRTSILPFGNGTVFDPAPGYSVSGHLVTISTSTNPAGGTVYYTTDGTDPTENPALIYTGPFMISQTTTVKAMARYPDICPSIIYTGVFVITGRVDTPVFDPTPNSYATPISVSISTILPGTQIYYTLNGADPLPTSISADSYEYLGPINLPAGQHYIRARAYKDHWDPSLIRDGYYSIGVLPAPTFNLPAGNYQDPILVRLAVPSVPDASIHYTLDGSTPTIGSTNYDDTVGIPVPVETSMTIKAIAWKAGWQTSDVATRTYNVTGTAVAPVFNPGGGQYASATNVTITSSTLGATIKYTLDGVDPTDTYGIIYTGPVNIAVSSTLKARAFLSGWRQSTVTSADYTIFGIVGNPVFVPGAGTYTSPVNVYISVTPPDADIYYTTDGSTPSSVNGSLYTPGSPILISNNTLLKAVAEKTGWNNSAVVSAQYIITGTVTAPVFNPLPGQFASAQSVAISAVPPTATIIYTTDGTIPSQSNGIVYTTPINITNSTTITAYAYLAGWTDSPVSTGLYVINGNVATPVIAPAGGYYNAPQTVSISAYPGDATIVYTLDGSIPTPSHGSVYAGAFQVSSHTIVKAMAYKTEWLNSATATAEYFFTVANPVFSLASGSYPVAQILTISAPTPGSTVRYTTDGSDPSDTNGIPYTGPVDITTNTNIKAVAYKAGWNNSSIVAAQYIINGNVATPVFSLASGNYFTEQLVGITTFPSDATIYYTLDGSVPSDVNGSVYTGPINITQNTVIRAIAYRANWLPSGIATGTYDLYVLPISFTPPQGLYSSAQNVIVSTSTTGVSLYYTTDGTDPSMLNGTLYTGPVNVSNTLQLRAIAYKTGWHPSTIGISDYVINIPVPVVAVPVFSIPAGVYNAPQVVGISVATPGATIRYTTDGTDPSLVNGQDYSGPINVNVTTQIRAYAYLAGHADSPIVMSNYIIILPVQTVATPTFAPPGGVYNNSVDVTISTVTPGSDIYYTTDGSEPSDVNGFLYSAPITITSTTTIKAVAYKSGWDHSLISNAGYVIFIPVQTVDTPILLPAPGTYAFAQSVTIATTTPGSIIMYTTDGTVPTLTNGSVYLSPINIGLNTTMTIKAIAFKDGWNNSQMAAGTYIITGAVEPVVFEPNGGTYTSSQTVIITCPTTESSIRYTLDGSEPTLTSPVYNTGIVLPLNSTTMIKAKAFKTNWTPSITGTQTYIITGQVAITAPVFSIPAGTYTAAQNVSISGSYIPADATI
ncbi:MAG TPA: chitobiase/beta-hexosaminidase C-terminal domain-containing protein, partial [Candidatus Cloacimonadota bacterium]|nr:chitobiase/beta-hexosaminidase C-terminal domain-containing protein [Candidatus Cloacimonadota bacterium]